MGKVDGRNREENKSSEFPLNFYTYFEKWGFFVPWDTARRKIKHRRIKGWRRHKNKDSLIESWNSWQWWRITISKEASGVDRFRETRNRTVGVRGSVGGEAGGIESLSLGRGRVLAIVCTMTWVYLTLLNRILKIMRMVNFLLRVFGAIKKKKGKEKKR